MHLRGNLRSLDLMNITQNRLKPRHIGEGRGETACLPELMSPGVTGIVMLSDVTSLSSVSSSEMCDIVLLLSRLKIRRFCTY